MLQKAIGCMIGGAYGDSLGAAVEFMTLKEIRLRYGQKGIAVCRPAFGHPAGTITDDTQMAMATAQGVLNLPPRELTHGSSASLSIWKSYLLWLKSQKDARQRRAPGSTCLSALSSGRMGTITSSLNYSAGCGAVMRAHPIGIALSSNPKLAFQLGMESGAITHGDPDGYVPAGALAMLIALLVSGLSMQEGIRAVVQEVQRLGKKTATGTLTAIKQALDAPTSGDLGLKIDSLIGRTGKYPGGWMGHDALAIALYAVRCAPNDPIEATKIAVNHSGDSDSTGSIAGAIMGATYGPNAFYSELKRSRIKLEHRSSLERLARRLWETSGRVDATDFSWVDLRLWLKRTPSNWRSKF